MMYLKYIITGKNKIVRTKTEVFYTSVFVLKNIQIAYNINTMININNILRCFPNNAVKKIDEYFTLNNINLNYLEEIRIRVNRPIIMKLGQAEIIIEYNIKADEILEILQQICDNSIYSYQNQIVNRIYYTKGRT